MDYSFSQLRNKDHFVAHGESEGPDTLGNGFVRSNVSGLLLNNRVSGSKCQMHQNYRCCCRWQANALKVSNHVYHAMYDTH
jgi:hypothetical protein